MGRSQAALRPTPAGLPGEGWLKLHSCLVESMELYPVCIHMHGSWGSANTGHCGHKVVALHRTLWSL